MSKEVEFASHIYYKGKELHHQITYSRPAAVTGEKALPKLLTKKRVVISILVLFAAAVVYFGAVNYDYVNQLPIGSGYKAKIMGSGYFVSGREPEHIEENDLSFDPAFGLFKTKINQEQQHSTASFFGLVKARAVYREGLGCILLSGRDSDSVYSWPVDIPEPLPENPEEVPWPDGARMDNQPVLREIDRAALDRALERAFSELNPEKPRRTRAVVVVYKNRLAAEKYAPDIDRDMPLIGWSMTKSVTSALVGILAGRGDLKIEHKAPVPEWQAPDDPRRNITLNHLLHMSPGLKFAEGYASTPLSDVNQMLFTQPDMAAFAADFPLEAKPGEKFNYSSGTTNIISRIIRQCFASLEEYFAFPRLALFNKIGIRTAVWEPDASGTLVGASYLYASARDWARFGLLYLNDGVWNGEQILPPGWVEYTTTPAPAAEKGQYGAHFWLNHGSPDNPENRTFPSLPRDLFYCSGYQGQSVVIIPSCNLVVVRLGMTTQGGWDLEEFIGNVLKAFPIE